MDGNDIYETKRGRYTAAEKKILASGDVLLSLEACKDRHPLSSIYTTFSMMNDSGFTRDGIPKSLYRLCVKLGLITSGSRPSRLAGKRISAYQKKIVRYLASLPNAENFSEAHWLDTPELWPFIDFDSIIDTQGESCGDLRKELLEKMENWCDRWIPFSSVSHSEIRKHLDRIYIFPFKDHLDYRTASKYSAAFAAAHSYLAESQAVYAPEYLKIPPEEEKRVRELTGRMSIGYISFKCGIQVADVLHILDT